LIKWIYGLLCLALAVDVNGQVEVRVSTGYEQENFHWSIAGNGAGQDPNIYSELKWRGVGGFSGEVNLQWSAWKRWRVFAGAGRAFFHSGKMSDTDYGLDNRNDVLYHQEFSVTSGYNEHGAIGIGYALIVHGAFRLTPFIGYGISQQYFPITDEGGPFSSLNSSYSAKWLGPFVRAMASWQVFPRWQLEGMVRYDQVVYRAVADWNLITDFSHPVSFRHHADGFGVTGELGLRYTAGRRWSVFVNGSFFDQETGEGVDELYLRSGSVEQTQLNGVGMVGFGTSLGLQWRL
jgi:hypothetical protein